MGITIGTLISCGLIQTFFTPPMFAALSARSPQIHLKTSGYEARRFRPNRFFAPLRSILHDTYGGPDDE